MDLSDATAGLSLSDSDVTMFITGLSRMRTTGKATTEYLNYFSERGVDVYQALSEALQENGQNVDKSGIAELISKGAISGDTASEAILQYIKREYGGLSSELASTYDAMVANLGDATTSLNAVMGNAYNEIDKSRIQREMDFYDSEAGAALEEAYGIIGASQAYAESYKNEILNAARTWILTGEESDLFTENMTYQDTNVRDWLTSQHEEFENLMLAAEDGSETAGIHMEGIINSADALAQTMFDSSDFAKAQAETEQDLIEATQNLTASFNSFAAAYGTQQALTKGLAAVTDYRASWAIPKISDDEKNAIIHAPTSEIPRNVSGYAYGLNRVPYDDFPAILHEDERILTASEARSYESSRAIQVTVTGNEFVVRDETDIDAIAEKIATELSIASALS